VSDAVINELSALFMTFSFKDQNDANIIPATIDWRVDNITDRHNVVQVLDWASISTPAVSVDVQIPGTSNAITNQDHVVERREVTVRIDAGQSTQAYKAYLYNIKNLYGQS